MGTRTVRIPRQLDLLWHDVRHSLRTIRKTGSLSFGARTQDIVTRFLHSLRKPLIVGLAGGCGLATFGILLLNRTRVMTDVSLGDPLAFGAAIMLLLCTAAGATLIPAFRAARREPWSALRDS